MPCIQQQARTVEVRHVVTIRLLSMWKSHWIMYLAVQIGAHELFLAGSRGKNHSTPVEKPRPPLTPQVYKTKPSPSVPTPQQPVMTTPLQQPQGPMMMNDMQLVMIPILMGDGVCGVAV